MASRAYEYILANGLYLFLLELGRRFKTGIRSSALGRSLGAKDFKVGARSYVRGARCMLIGKGFRSGDDLWIEAVTSYGEQSFSPRINIGENVRISRWTHISAIYKIEIGSDTLIGSRVLIIDHNHGSYSGANSSCPEMPPRDRPLGGGGPVIIGRNVWVGDNVSIVGPVRIGNGAVIGANSLVIRDVPDATIAAGIPARSLKSFDPTTGSWV